MDFATYLQQTFPGVRITSGRRDPNSRLGRANPRSFHNVGKAWDVSPIPGMSHDDFVGRVRKDGWNVLEALDEATRPLRHTTGPNWHTAVDGRKEPRMGLADIMAGIAPLARQEQQQGVPLAPPAPPVAPAQPQQDSLAQYVAMMGSEKRKRPVWKDVLGGVLDGVARATGGEGGYWPGIEKENDAAQKVREKLAELIYQRNAKQEDRAASLEDWRVKRREERADPEPVGMVRDLEAWNNMTPQQQAEYARMMDIKSPIAVSGPTGVSRVPRTFGQPIAGRAVTLPDGTVAYNINGEWYDNPEGR